MRLSQGFWNTFKETPAEAEIISHKLMLRAGLIQKLGSGLYNYMPIMMKSIQKIEKIIRQELNKVPCHEVSLCVLTPGELWEETQRLEGMGSLILKARDRHERTLCVSPTNEEAITHVFRKSIHSHKQLPITLYQINTKFRDEIRPRFGVMRAREFSMADAYSFHANLDCLRETYQKMMDAYKNAFDRMGLKYCMVQADPGAIGPKESQTHEFHVLALAGEDELIKCTKCDYAANGEMSTTHRNLSFNTTITSNVEKVHTPNCPTIESVCQFLKVEQFHSLKSIVVIVQNKPVLLLLLGDDQVNEFKLQKIFANQEYHWATDQELLHFGFIKGFIGPYKSIPNLRIIFDTLVAENASYSIGANEKDYHFQHFNIKRDLKDHQIKYEFADFRKSRNDDFCNQCKNPVEILRGIEIGHIFQLGDKYTKSMKAMVTDAQGNKIYPLMGCYGIGVTRIVASAIEQSHDEKGICWNKSITPYHVYLSSIGKANSCELIDEIREECAYKLEQEGFDVLHDDRHATAGVIFNDADLLGLPLRVIVGEKQWNANKKVEVTLRSTKETHLLSVEEMLEFVKNFYKL